MEYYKFLRQYVGNAPIMLTGSGVLIYSGSRILLQKRKDDGCWGKHGGVVELWENTEDTVRRELCEEINVRVGRLELFGVYSGPDYKVVYKNGDVCNYVDVVYITNELLSEPVPDNTEVEKTAWFDINELPANIHLTDRAPIYDLAKKLGAENK